MPLLSWLHLLVCSTNKWYHSNAYRLPYLVGLLSVESWPIVGASDIFVLALSEMGLSFLYLIYVVYMCDTDTTSLYLLWHLSLSLSLSCVYSILNQLTCCFWFSISLWIIGAGTNLRIHTESWCFQMVTNAGMGLIEVWRYLFSCYKVESCLCFIWCKMPFFKGWVRLWLQWLL